MENQKLRRPLASLTMLCLVITQFTTGVFPIPIAPIESAHATNVVTLGSSYESVRIGDSLSPSANPSVLEQNLNCDNGDVVTSIFFKEEDSGNYQDSIDAIGIGCSPLLDDGTVDYSNEEDKLISNDFSGNSSNEERVTCPSGSAASVVKYRGLTFSTGISDHTDSVTLVCSSVDNNGVGSIAAELSFPSLQPGNNLSDVIRACDSGGLVTGITYRS